jgi:uncharacterized membrane protein YkgB
VTRIGLVIVLAWIGRLKAFRYADERIVPFVARGEQPFPLLSSAGRLVVKDAIMAGAALVTMADSANAYQRRNEVASTHTFASELLLTTR